MISEHTNGYETTYKCGKCMIIPLGKAQYTKGPYIEHFHVTLGDWDYLLLMWHVPSLNKSYAQISGEVAIQHNSDSDVLLELMCSILEGR